MFTKLKKIRSIGIWCTYYGSLLYHMCCKNCQIWSVVIFFRTSPSSYREEEKSQGVVWLWTRKWGWTKNRSGRHCGNHQTGKEIPLTKVHRDLINDFKKMAMILKKFLNIFWKLCNIDYKVQQVYRTSKCL